MRKGGITQRVKLTLISDFLQLIVVDRGRPIAKKRRLFWLRRVRPARSPWRRDYVRISHDGRPFLDGGVHLFRMDHAVRLVQLFAQVLGGRSRLGARRRLTWSRVEGRRWVWRLGQCYAGDKGGAGDQQAKS
jgi:hypothetical protein